MAATSRSGILAVNPSAIKKPTMSPAPPRVQGKSGMPKLRLILRRLPPGLTKVEFHSALGDEWKVGAGKVEWAAYKEGKISKDPSKPSRPARAYLKVKEQLHLDQLSIKIKQTAFQDARNTTNDPCLLGPPSLEFAPYGKVPGSRVRHDGRAGTIDQDPEFIDFLQSLTEPATKPTAPGEEETKHSKITTTPLVQFIKEKKANKAKDALAAKTAKASGKVEPKDTKSEKPGAKISVVKASPIAEKAKREKATQDAVKAINKTVTAMSGKVAPPKLESGSAMKSNATTQPTPRRERERGNASVAAKILQRDLGLGPKERRTPTTTKASTTTSEPTKGSTTPVVKVNLPSSGATTQTPTSTTQAQSQSNVTNPTPPTGPRNAKPGPASAPAPKPAPTQRSTKAAPQPSSGAKSAFLKHANPSQGVTEPLLEAAFSEFGALVRCEIDKKKGFGYVDFADTEGLKKAMLASPVKVGNGQVVVLENKSKPPARTPLLQNPPTIQQNKPQTAQSLTQPVAQPQTKAGEPASAATPAPASISTTTTALGSPPTAPRGANVASRGGRGGHLGPGRSGFGPPGRGGRGGFRGRGGFFPNQARGGGQAAGIANTAAQANQDPASPMPVTAPPPSSAATAAK